MINPQIKKCATSEFYAGIVCSVGERRYLNVMWHLCNIIMVRSAVFIMLHQVSIVSCNMSDFCRGGSSLIVLYYRPKQLYWTLTCHRFLELGMSLPMNGRNRFSS